MPHNPHRGEVEATFGDACYHLRLTLGALAELEAELGAGSLLELIERFEQGRFSTREIIALIAAGLRGAGHDLSTEQVARLHHEQGVRGFVRIAGELLAAAFPDNGEQS